MMKLSSFYLAFGLSLVSFSAISFAQMQQGYADKKPDITVDRSVLEDLKDYQPPPMFGATPPKTPASKPAEVKIAPPSAPKLTAPKAEDLLNHPVENFRVLTERDSLESPSQQTKVIQQPVQNKLQKEAKKEPQKSAEKPKEKTKEAIVKKIEPVVQKTPTAYRPKSPQSMPAVPPIRVEKSELPPLPPTAPSGQPTSIGERLMDAALERQMETDERKIKEKLATTVKTDSKKNDKPTPILKPSQSPSNTLIFSASEITLTDKMQQHIQTNILPNLQENKNARIQILAFATSPDKSESGARRISLARSLAVRDYLKEQGIDVSRIDVRALAAPDGSSPADKVDIVLLK